VFYQYIFVPPYLIPHEKRSVKWKDKIFNATFKGSYDDLVEILKDLTNFKGKIIWNNSKPDGTPRRCYKL
jgi:hypothetical protein